MTFAELLASTSLAKLEEMAKKAASASKGGLIWNVSVQTILKAASKNASLAPTLKADTDFALITKWLRKYTDAYNNRISVRASNLPGTIPDPMVETIIACRLQHLKSADLAKITFGHRLSMSGENVLGLLLEEFLSIELGAFSWHSCWGETLRSVDFVNEDGRLLQVKNRSNSENSSSSRVRIGTDIEKWFRVNAADGEYLWEDLNRLHKTAVFSEQKFKDFVVKTLKTNPNAMPVENANPWK